MAEPIKPTRVVYHKDTGPVEMYAIDAQAAVTGHPGEWSYEPFDGSEGIEKPNGEPRVVIPNGWMDLPASQRLSIARELGAKDIRSGAQADDFINDYLVQRANAGVTETSKSASMTERPAADAKERARSAALEIDEGRTDKSFDNNPTPPPPAPLGPKENNPKD